MNGTRIIKVWVMEDQNPKRSILNLLTDFSTKNKIELQVFHDEDSLYNQLSKIKLSEDEKVHNIILFHSDKSLNNIIKVIDKIKSDPVLRATPVFIITSSVEHKELLEAYKCHLNCFITKTEDFSGLIDILNSFKDFWYNIVRLP